MILLNDAADPIHPTVDAIDQAAATTPPPAGPSSRNETPREIVIDAEAPRNSFLLLADTFYPGWTANVDGTRRRSTAPTMPCGRIQLPRGRHEVRFVY